MKLAGQPTRIFADCDGGVRTDLELTIRQSLNQGILYVSSMTTKDQQISNLYRRFGEAFT
jgi:hypothetical protein